MIQAGFVKKIQIAIKVWIIEQRLAMLQFSLMGWVALFYLCAIVLAEVSITYFLPRFGLALHGFLLLFLLIQSALSEHIRTRRFLIALSLSPLTRVLSLVLPLKHFPLIYWYIIVGAPLAVAAILATKAGNLRWLEVGLTFKKLPLQAPIALLGIGLGYLEYMILRPSPLVLELKLEQVWLPALILLIFTGLLEEYIFRGLLQRTAISRLGRGGVIYSASVFSALHIGYHSLLDIFFVFLVALLFSWIVLRTGSIIGVSLAHGITNICLFLIFPFLLSAAPL